MKSVPMEDDRKTAQKKRKAPTAGAIFAGVTDANVEHSEEDDDKDEPDARRMPDTIVANRPWRRSQRARLNISNTATWNVLPRELRHTVLCYVIDDPALTDAIVLEQYGFLHTTPCLRTADILAALCQLLNAKSHSISPDVLLGHLRSLQKNVYDRSALLPDAAKQGYDIIVSWCVVHTNPPISVSTKTDALLLASENGHAAVVELLLLKAGADVHVDDDAPLLLASENGHAAVVELLLQAGANVHAWDDAPLRYASENGHAAVVELLLQAGANVRADGDGALLWASSRGHLAVVELLLKAGANARVRDGAMWQRDSHMAYRGHIAPSV